MMDNENEFMIVCVFLWLFVVFVGAGCSDEWKEREEVWNKKMKHRSGSAHKQLFYSEFVIRVGIRIVVRGFFEAIFFFISFFPQTMYSLWPLDFIFPEVQHRNWNAWIKWNETHTQNHLGLDSSSTVKVEKNSFICWIAVECDSFVDTHTRTHIYIYVCEKRGLHIADSNEVRFTLLFVLIQKQNSNDIKENWWQIKSTILVSFHKTVNANGVANLDKIINVRRQILT